MTQSKLIIATRESPLALWQANWVKDQLLQLHPTLSVQLLGITTQADKMLTTPLYKVGGKGLFVKELEEALLEGRADIAVHSMKDVPMQLPPGLAVPVMCDREDPRDALVAEKTIQSIAMLPKGSTVGTSSLRRQSQLLALRPDLKTAFLRGNVQTRLKKLAQGEFSAIILAAAGLKRLALEDCISGLISTDEMLPAAGQGVLGIECRVDDEKTQQLIAPLNHAVAFQCVSAERAMCRYLGGGCHVPIAAYAEMLNGKINLRGLVANESGTQILRTHQVGDKEQAEQLGTMAAKHLLQQGAEDLLK